MREGATRIGRYELLGELALGGMAEILLARVVGPGGFERPVVIKRILPHLARQSAFIEMFLDEARIAASIRHHNVIHVHELTHDVSDLFLVMEYLEGESVAGLMRRLTLRDEGLDRALAGYIVAETCAGVHAAHELVDPNGATQNLVHRDVSPQNVFVTYDGQVKVLDFGIAMASDRIARTEAGQLKGKFGYMSPEQCRGEPLDRRSDVFALGILLYELTTERRLFRGVGPVDTIRAICADEVVPPSRVVEGYPAAIERVCMRALSASRDDRYPTTSDMRRDLLLALRSLESKEEPAEALARRMRSLFPDRIAEKSEMLRRVQSGSKVTHVPAGEVDERVELAGVPTEVAMGSFSPRRPRRGWALVLAGAVTAVLAAGGAMALRTQRAARQASVSGAASSGALPALPGGPLAGGETAAASTASGGEAATVKDVLIHIETRPPGATASVGGEDRGRTPLDIRLPRGDSALDVQLRRPGYAVVAQAIVPNADQRLLLELDPVAPSRARSVRASLPMPSPPPATAGSSPWTKWH
jgi:serine/threonine protein kinase